MPSSLTFALITITTGL